MTELKPCPFCGRESKFIGDGRSIKCTACGGAFLCANPLLTAKEVAEAWDKRADENVGEELVNLALSGFAFAIRPIYRRGRGVEFILETEYTSVTHRIPNVPMMYGPLGKGMLLSRVIDGLEREYREKERQMLEDEMHETREETDGGAKENH